MCNCSLVLALFFINWKPLTGSPHPLSPALIGVLFQQCPLLALSVGGPQMVWVFVCVCVDRMNLKYALHSYIYIYISTYQFIPYYASVYTHLHTNTHLHTHLHAHTHILKPFWGQWTDGAKSEYIAFISFDVDILQKICVCVCGGVVIMSRFFFFPRTLNRNTLIVWPCKLWLSTTCNSNMLIRNSGLQQECNSNMLVRNSGLQQEALFRCHRKFLMNWRIFHGFCRQLPCI